MKNILILVVALACSACTWVRVTPGSESVSVAQSVDQLSHCEKIGNVSAQVASKVVFSRNPEKVEAELFQLARNKAADMGANAIAPTGPIKDGARSFAIFSCPH